MLDLTIGAPQKHETLTLYPLIAPEKLELPYALLGDALETGTLEVTEVGDGVAVDVGGDAGGAEGDHEPGDDDEHA